MGAASGSKPKSMTMNYASKQDMMNAYTEEALIELTDREDVNAINDDVLDRAISEASSLIDSFVSRRYDTTQARSALVLRDHAVAIAFYKLHRGNRPDQVRTDFEDSMEFLRSVSTGTANLDVGGRQAPSAPADARVEGPDRIFNRDTMKGF